MSVETYTKSGIRASTPAKLDKSVFGLKVDNYHLLKEVYLSHMTGKRSNFAKTKTRGEVRGGGQKPWRQKGTGRARFGSSRNPIWTGGGVAFGPTGSENYDHKTSTKAKRQALKQALSLAAKEDRIKVIETFACPDGKVKPTLDLFKKINAQGSILLVVSVKDSLVERATRNISNLKAVQVNYLGVFDVLNADTVVISKKSIDALTSRLTVGPQAKETVNE